MILHLINYKDTNRGGAQKILEIIHGVTGGEVLCLSDARSRNKFIAVCEIYWRVIKYFINSKSENAKTPLRSVGTEGQSSTRFSHVVAHSRMYLPLVVIARWLGAETTFYTHAMYRCRPWLMRLMQAQSYVAVSQSVKSYLLDIGIQSNKISIITNPILNVPELTDWSSLDSDGFPTLTSQPNAESQHIVFECFSIGALEQWKGFKETILTLERTAKKLKIRIQYTLVGSGSQQQDLELLASSLKSDHFEVFLLGRLEHPFECVKSIKTQLIPSLEEGFGLVAIEGVAAGKVILYRRIPALHEIGKDDPLCLEYDRDQQLETLIKELIFGESLILEEKFFAKRKKGVELQFSCDKFKKAIKTNFISI